MKLSDCLRKLLAFIGVSIIVMAIFFIVVNIVLINNNTDPYPPTFLSITEDFFSFIISLLFGLLGFLIFTILRLIFLIHDIFHKYDIDLIVMCAVTFTMVILVPFIFPRPGEPNTAGDILIPMFSSFGFTLALGTFLAIGCSWLVETCLAVIVLILKKP